MRLAVSVFICAVLAAAPLAAQRQAKAGPPPPAPAGVITGAGNFSHIVADFSRSLTFYRDVIGLEVAQPPSEFSGNPAILDLGNTPGAQSRYGTLRILGSELGVELIEYKDIERHPAQPRFQDPGAANLILNVRDIDPILAKVEAAGGRIQTLGGKPASIAEGSRTVFIQDPDGFFIELSERKPVPEDALPVNVYGASFEIVVEDTEATMKLWRDVLGFDVQTGDSFNGNELMMNTAGTPGAAFKSSAGRIPGTRVRVAFLEFKDIDRKKLDTDTQDPGTPILQLRSGDVEGVAAAWKAAGGEVVSSGGKAVSMGDRKLVLLRDPNGVMLEILSGQ